MNIMVEDVRPNRVAVRAENVRFVFKGTKRGIRLVSKGKPYAQTHDPNACWVPAKTFSQVCRTAAAILNENKKPAPTLAPEKSLVPV